MEGEFEGRGEKKREIERWQEGKKEIRMRGESGRGGQKREREVGGRGRGGKKRGMGRGLRKGRDKNETEKRERRAEDIERLV